MGVVAPRSVGSLSFWPHTGDFGPMELLGEMRACPAQGMAGLGVLLCQSLWHWLWAQAGREGAEGAGSTLLEQVGGGKGVSVRLGPARGLGRAAEQCQQLPKWRVVGACSFPTPLHSPALEPSSLISEWLKVEGFSKHITHSTPLLWAGTQEHRGSLFPGPAWGCWRVGMEERWKVSQRCGWSHPGSSAVPG